ncbi:MAG: hypothetical protein HYY04_09480 [Chloroflexi bacterium]|nr:hypothetical protein [Chloroflexota bacterium]
MARVSMAYGLRNVLLAEQIAQENGGLALEQHPPGFVSVEASPRLRITREMVQRALGRELSDQSWRNLFTNRRGVLTSFTDQEIVIDDDPVQTGYALHMPTPLFQQIEAAAARANLSVRDLILLAVQRYLGENPASKGR